MRGPFHDGAFDQTGMQHHHGFGTGRILHAGLGACIELAPCRAFAVEQRFPPNQIEPVVDRGLGNTLFFKVVKFIRKLMFCQPTAGFFHRVAVGNAINLDAE